MELRGHSNGHHNTKVKTLRQAILRHEPH